MRKRTIKCLFDNIFWYLIYSLPLLLMLLHWFKVGTIDISNVFAISGLSLLSDNVVFVGLSNLFGANGVMPLFASDGLLLFLSYFVICWLVHLAVDVLLFIVRLAHSWLDGFLGGKHD